MHTVVLVFARIKNAVPLNGTSGALIFRHIFRNSLTLPAINIRTPARYIFIGKLEQIRCPFEYSQSIRVSCRCFVRDQPMSRHLRTRVHECSCEITTSMQHRAKLKGRHAKGIVISGVSRNLFRRAKSHFHPPRQSAALK